MASGDRSVRLKGLTRMNDKQNQRMAAFGNVQDCYEALRVAFSDVQLKPNNPALVKAWAEAQLAYFAAVDQYRQLAETGTGEGRMRV